MISDPITKKFVRLAGALFAGALFAGIIVSGCATHCGIMNYCDIPEDWPIADTFTVEAAASQLCISGTRRSSCATKGLFQTGTRAVQVHTIDDDEEESHQSELLASLLVTGSPGDQFKISCFQYNGEKILGMTEVLTGFEVRDQAGTVVATHPTRPVTRRSSLLLGC